MRTTDLQPGLVYLVLITGGLVWQGALAYLVLRREVVPFTWANLKRRLWLDPPTNPRTGQPSKKLLLWAAPFALALLAWDMIGPLDWLNDLWVDSFPAIDPPDYALIENLADPAVGQWWLLSVLIVLIAFNYLLGEELIFRGVLLPRMYGVFGPFLVVLFPMAIMGKL